MRKGLLPILLLFACLSYLNAQTTRNNTGLVPTGKGWGEVAAPGLAPALVDPDTVHTGNGINYHGGQVMGGNPVNAYFIWYGNWVNGPKPSDSQTTVNLINALFASSGGIGGSGYFRINTTYGDNSKNVSGNVAVAASTFNNYSNGKSLSDAAIRTIVSNAISSGALPKSTNGVYFVLTSSDVTATSGFCTQYCGWHTHATISASDIKYAFVGNPDRCPSACEAQTISPNGDSGADGMASIMAHEAEEAITDPDLNAWYDTRGFEDADKCAWMWGPTTGTVGNGGYNQTFGSHHWLIQMEWENARKGGCDQTLGGPFYRQ
jgi:hypothetical protein